MKTLYKDIFMYSPGEKVYAIHVINGVLHDMIRNASVLYNDAFHLMGQTIARFLACNVR